MLVLINIIGAVKAAVAAIYQSVYTDADFNFYTDNNNEPYTT
jgi:hypothetical protein